MVKLAVKFVLIVLALHAVECKSQVSYVIDTEFDSETSVFGTFSNAVIQEDGKIMAAGRFGDYGAQETNLVRLYQNGQKDLSFPNTVMFSSIYGGLFYHNGLYLYSYFRGCLEDDCSNVTCYKTDGTQCTSTDWSMPYFYEPYGMTLMFPPLGISLGDTAVLMAGAFHTDLENPSRWQCLVRTFVDGTHDTTFTKFEQEPNGPKHVKLRKTPDGGFFLAGGFSSINNYYSPGIIKLTSELEIDSSFISPFNSVNVTNINIDNSGRPWLTAWYANIGNSIDTTITLMRLNQNGSVDSTFNSPIFEHFQSQYASGGIYITTLLEDDNGYIIGGEFSKINGVQRNCIAKLSETGELILEEFTDNYLEYYIPYGFGYPLSELSMIWAPKVTQLTSLPDGKILVGGNFNFEINGQYINNLMRLKKHVVSTENIQAEISNVKIFPNPANAHLNIILPNNLKKNGTHQLEILNLDGQIIKNIIPVTNGSSYYNIDIRNLSSGLYILLIKHNDKVLARNKFVIH